VGDVIENAYSFNAEAVLRLSEPTKTLDTTLGDLRRLVPEVGLESLDGRALVRWKARRLAARLAPTQNASGYSIAD
jgi:hypothetical protein